MHVSSSLSYRSSWAGTPGDPGRARVLPILLAGGRGTRLHELTARLCKPAIPFVGNSRIVDFTLANLERSRLPSVIVATQYCALPLERHLRGVWADRLDLKLRHAPTLTGRAEGSRGTADAVRVVLDEIDAIDPDELLILAADHIYAMDYRPMLASHRERGAVLTVAADLVSRSEAPAFGIIEADRGDRIRRFVEKPQTPPPSAGDPARCLASMGLYVIDWPWLRDCLLDHPEALDFGHHVLPISVAEGRSFVHAPGRTAPLYWRDVGTLDALRRAALDFAGDAPPIPIPGPPRRRADPEGLIDSFAMEGSLVSRGALLSRCVVAPGTVVPFGTRIGVDPRRDRLSFRRSSEGTLLVTPETLAASRPAQHWNFPL